MMFIAIDHARIPIAFSGPIGAVKSQGLKLDIVLSLNLGCHSTRASRRIPILLFHPQKAALIESMNPQWQDSSASERGPEKRRDSTRGTRRMMRWTQPVFNGFIKEPAMVTRPSKRTTGGSTMQVTRIGMDIAKQIFDLHGVDRRGKVVCAGRSGVSACWSCWRSS